MPLTAVTKRVHCPGCGRVIEWVLTPEQALEELRELEARILDLTPTRHLHPRGGDD